MFMIEIELPPVNSSADLTIELENDVEQPKSMSITPEKNFEMEMF